MTKIHISIVDVIVLAGALFQCPSSRCNYNERTLGKIQSEVSTENKYLQSGSITRERWSWSMLLMRDLIVPLEYWLYRGCDIIYIFDMTNGKWGVAKQDWNGAPLFNCEQRKFGMHPRFKLTMIQSDRSFDYGTEMAGAETLIYSFEFNKVSADPTIYRKCILTQLMAQGRGWIGVIPLRIPSCTGSPMAEPKENCSDWQIFASMTLRWSELPNITKYQFVQPHPRKTIFCCSTLKRDFHRQWSHGNHGEVN